MIIDRAIEIMSSTENIRVLYANDPVWIESIDKDTRKATVRVLDTNQVEEVLVSSLTDTGAKM
jgi:H-type small acid-soluble spore protein